MGSLKPPLIVVVMVEVPWLPCATVSEEGEAETVKPGCWGGICATNKMLNKQKCKAIVNARTRLVMSAPWYRLAKGGLVCQVPAEF
jgi:hypothetical protein